MLDAIKDFFSERIGQAGQSEQDEEQRLQLATAALLIEVSRADYVQEELELDTIHWAIGQTFKLSPEDTNALIEMAEEEVSESTSYYDFTSLINQSFSAEEKVRVIELMWRVAFADGELDKYEEALVRRIADLIYVPHKDFIATKLKVEGGSAPAGAPSSPRH